MNKNTFEALNLADILTEIKPLSLGKQWQHRPYSPQHKQKLQNYFEKLKLLLNSLEKNPQLSTQLSGQLVHLNNIKNTLNKLEKIQILQVFEVQEIKNLLYFYLKIKKILQKNKLSIIQLPKVEKLFSFLDKEDQNSPVFHLSNCYSAKYAKLLQEYEQTTKKLAQLRKENLQKAASQLNMTKAKPQIVVSRLDKKQIEKLTNSESYYLEAENFANYTFQIRKTEAILELENIQNTLQTAIEKESSKILEKISKVISVYEEELSTIFSELTKLDMLLAKAEFCRKHNCCVPNITRKLSLKQARNLPLEWELSKNNIALQPVDINLQNKVNIITGTNMAGKTTVLKTIGQIVYLANCGIPVPCQKADLPLVEFIFFSGYQQSRMDLSSFASEVVEINEVLSEPGSGLVLIDEFARGTNPEEGEAFSKAVLEVFLEKESLVVAATHFSAPAQIKKAAHFRIKGIKADNYAKLQQLPNLQNRLAELHKFMDYSLKQVAVDSPPPKAALIIAEILGIDRKIIKKAKDFLNDK